MQPPYQPHYPPPPPQLPRNPKRWPWIVAIIVVFFLGIGVGHSGASDTQTGVSPIATTQDTTVSAQPTQTPTPKPTAKPLTWQTTHTFTGNGAKKTETFTVGDDWKISWSCQGIDGIDAPLFISVKGDVDDFSAASTTCKASGPKTTGTTEEHQGGNVYLDINSGIDWTITIQELK